MLGGAPGAGVRVHFRGSFTGPFSEALVEVVRCEPHSMWWGGTVVVREVDGGWVPVAYAPGFLPDKCELRRGPDAIDRLACVEFHGENGGTYETAATVTDFHARRQHTLSGAECEDARDVEKIRWAGPTGFDVDVTLLHSMRRASHEGCGPVGAPVHTLVFRYLEKDGSYEPDARSFKLLLTLLPRSSSDLSPAVREATGARERLPAELSPSSGPLEIFELGKCPEGDGPRTK